MENTDILKYPIGRFTSIAHLPFEAIRKLIMDLEQFPEELEKALKGLSDEDLATRYRPEGWTIRQVVHHLADSHVNSYTRFKLALIEEKPVIKPYLEDRWAELEDGKHGEISPSLELLKGLHLRWGLLLRSLKEKDFDKTFFHPGHKREISLKENLGMYVWHGKHHLAHIEAAKKRLS